MTTIFIDTREPYEYDKSHVEGAINIPPMEMMQGLPKQLEDVPKDTELVLYCISGARSNTSMQFLRQYGFTNLTNGVNQRQVEAKYFR